MTKAQWLDLLERAAWTFVEGFLLGITFNGMDWKAILMGALGAGISSVKTLLLNVASTRLSQINKQINDDGVSLNNGTDIDEEFK